MERLSETAGALLILTIRICPVLSQICPQFYENICAPLRQY